MNETEHDYDSTAPQADPVLELRLLIYGLGVIVLLMSLALNLYIRKQNANIKTQVESLQTQVAQVEGSELYKQNKTAMQNLLNELKEQVQQHPEAQQMLARYGIQVQARPGPPRP